MIRRVWVSLTLVVVLLMSGGPSVATAQSDYTDAVIYHQIGRFYYDMGWYEESIDFFTAAIDLSPTYTLPYYFRGLAYYELELYKEGLQDCIWLI